MRLMIYDRTALDDGFDIRESNDNLTMSWVLGAKLYKATRSVDLVKGVASWAEALEWLNTVNPSEKIEQIQIWGHGWPGRSYIGKEFITLDDVVSGPLSDGFAKLKNRLTPDSIIWFRNCAVFCGEPGHKFAEGFSTHMGCVAAAHTYIIGLFQAGLHTIKPGQKAYWPVTEGIEEGPASWPKKIRWSRMWSENSIFCLRSDIPKGW